MSEGLCLVSDVFVRVEACATITVAVPASSHLYEPRCDLQGDPALPVCRHRLLEEEPVQADGGTGRSGRDRHRGREHPHPAGAGREHGNYASLWPLHGGRWNCPVRKYLTEAALVI